MNPTSQAQRTLQQIKVNAIVVPFLPYLLNGITPND